MGQKVNPFGLRVGVNQDWTSRWIANDKKTFAKWIKEDNTIREYIKENAVREAIAGIEIERIEKNLKIILSTNLPAIILGNGGENVQKWAKHLKHITKYENVKIDVVEVENAHLNAQLLANGIAKKLENRESFRNVQKDAITKALKAGALGIKTVVSGRLGGNDIARKEGYAKGSVPLHTLRSNIQYAHATARTTFGKLGIKVWVCLGEIYNKDVKEKAENATGEVK